MAYYAGIDVSLETSSICIVDAHPPFFRSFPRGVGHTGQFLPHNCQRPLKTDPLWDDVWSEPLRLDPPGSELSHVPDQLAFELLG
jgi:hypothetical protein